MDIVLDKIPDSLEELKALPYASLSEPEYGAALFVCAMTNYKDNKDTAISMLEFLKGPAGVSMFEKQFINDRLNGKDYVVRSFFSGTSPDNDYTPAMPYTISLAKREDTMQDGRIDVYLTSTGADSKRYIRMRLKPSTNQWFIEEQFILSDIRIPKSMDEWA
ncbi:MAG: hypothetical protein K5745_00060 [Saccharofermentans sp.]|nr:hypothetical protein [Saccharofermentans sp.]